MKHSITKIWVNEFDNATLKRVLSAIDEVADNNQQILPVYINSLGGEVHPLFAMIDALSHCPVPVCTIGLGTVQSAGVDLLAAGTVGYRYIGELTTLMVHDASDCFQNPKKNNDLQSYCRQSQKERDLSFEVFAKNTGKTREFWNEWLDARKNVDVFITAHEAVELGIADHIGIPVISLTSDFEIHIPEKNR